MSLRGHSGAVLEVRGRSLWKTAYGRRHSWALHEGAMIQAMFAWSKHVRAPVVLAFDGDASHHFAFEMQYVEGARQLCELPELELRAAWSLLMEHLSSEVSHSTAQHAPWACFEPKLTELSANLGSLAQSAPTRRAMDACRERLQSGVDIPHGRCHGDMTFSNVLVDQQGKLVLVDFARQLFQSPAWDVAKLRQDTRHCWSYLWLPAGVQPQAPQLLEELDRELDEVCAGWKDAAPVLETLSLLRIAPYVREQRVAEWLERSLTRCLARYF